MNHYKHLPESPSVGYTLVHGPDGFNAMADSFEDAVTFTCRLDQQLAEVERLQAELVELRALADKRTRDERDGWCEREGECWLADGPCAGHDRHREGPLLQNIADDDARSAQHVDELYATIDDLTAEVERLRDERRWRAIVVEPPPPSTIVVAFDGEVFESHYSTRCGWTALRDGLPRTPTHWMPLPAPPEKEE